jgi:hypothetical protein
MSGLLLLGGTVALTALLRGATTGARRSSISKRPRSLFSPEHRIH